MHLQQLVSASKSILRAMLQWLSVKVLLVFCVNTDFLSPAGNITTYMLVVLKFILLDFPNWALYYLWKGVC
jgi:hypothetical protein